jgi:hypothetical protein
MNRRWRKCYWEIGEGESFLTVGLEGMSQRSWCVSGEIERQEEIRGATLPRQRTENKQTLGKV